MAVNKLHANETDTGIALAERLIATQFPQWAHLPLEPLSSSGTDNTIYRLGRDMTIRLPRIPDAAGRLEKEYRWLPGLAPLLPLTVPAPLARGLPGEGYPWHWAVYQWIEGTNVWIDRFAGSSQVALALAQFITALQQIDPTGGPLPGSHNSFRGAPLATRDASTRAAIQALSGKIDTAAVTKIWDLSLEAPIWNGAPVWIHGDLHSGNLLARHDHLSAVIDFGCLGIGDPACDLMTAWMLLSSATRKVFRKALSADDATWARGRGWALSVGLIALPYYEKSNPVLADIARHAIAEALADR